MGHTFVSSFYTTPPYFSGQCVGVSCSPKFPIPWGDLEPPPFNTWFRGPMRVCSPAIFAGLMVGNDTHTDRPCYSAIGHIYAMHAMWLNNVYSVLVLWVWLQEKHPTCIVEMWGSSKVQMIQMICIWFAADATVTTSYFVSWKLRVGLPLLAPAYPGCPRKQEHSKTHWTAIYPGWHRWADTRKAFIHLQPCHNILHFLHSVTEKCL